MKKCKVCKNILNFCHLSGQRGLSYFDCDKCVYLNYYSLENNGFLFVRKLGSDERISERELKMLAFM